MTLDSIPVLASLVAIILTMCGAGFALANRYVKRSPVPPPLPAAPPPIVLDLRNQENLEANRRADARAAHIDEVAVDAAKPVEKQTDANVDWANGRRRF